MHAHVRPAFALLLAVAVARAAGQQGVRLGYEREIASGPHDRLPQLNEYVLDDEYRAGAAAAAALRNKGRLVTRPRPDEAIVADNVILESNVVQILKPKRRKEESSPPAQAGAEPTVRRRRGYNLENVWVPARFPYLPYPSYTRFRRRN
ncbi:hypothetical protein EVAR_49361_1 [Eumeta japonica]|uniref:Uncharacterized protein n=1 Tax=Eumeta variegata TaxID=151549 RepID=A0A4C1XYW6_EUMVA|nr:hypothetical protein EVAR_49361_1 [Eumeta japonica]